MLRPTSLFKPRCVFVFVNNVNSKHGFDNSFKKIKNKKECVCVFVFVNFLASKLQSMDLISHLKKKNLIMYVFDCNFLLKAYLLIH